MGNQCTKAQPELNVPSDHNKDQILRLDHLSSSDIGFWSALKETPFFLIDHITNSSVEFKHNSLGQESLIAFSQVVDYLIRDHNFFFLIPIIEMTLAIIDFLEIVTRIKRQHKKDFFSLIYFDKLFLMKDKENRFSRLLYLDDKINEPFTMPELILTEDKSFFNSITGSMAEGANMKMVSAIALQKKTTDEFNQTIDQIDFNTFFYSNSKQHYLSLREKFSFEELDRFYANCMMYFIISVLFKKVTVDEEVFCQAYFHLKTSIRITFSNAFLEPQLGTLTLRKVKLIFTNFYLNNSEFLAFKASIDRIDPDDYVNAVGNLSSLRINQTDADRIIIKVKEYAQYDIGIVYGSCVYNHPDVEYHSCQFLSSNSAKGICLQCVHAAITQFFSIEQNRTGYFTLKEFEEALAQVSPLIKENVKEIIAYYCCALDETVKGQLGKVNASKLKIYRREEQIIFDLSSINLDCGSKSQFFIDDIINIDYKAKFHKESFKTKKTIPK